MQRRERKRATQEARSGRMLSEADYLLGVSDTARTGALRYRGPSDTEYQAPMRGGIPFIVDLGRLLDITERILRDEELDEDLEIIFAPGSSLGGARPKASVIDQHGNLSIAKFPKETDDYSVERWEHITLELLRRSGVRVAKTSLISVAGRPVLISHRFDRNASGRLGFISAMTILDRTDGDRASYPEIVDAISQSGGDPQRDIHELYRRLAFNVLVSNVDDHLRNHGFLRTTSRGWKLSPAYDVNPVPADIRPRFLSTNITFDESACDINLVLEAAEWFNLAPTEARRIVRDIAGVTKTWRQAAEAADAPAREIRLMESAFEHKDAEVAAMLL